MTFDIDTIAAELTEDGDSYEIPSENGTWTFRLAIKPDELSYEDMEDPEVFGKVAWIDRGRALYDKRLSPDGQRPSEFTGAARKLTVESYPGGSFWYEPPADFRRFKGSGFPSEAEWGAARDKHRDHVRSIVSWGYVYVIVTAEHRLPDGYHRKWDQSIGGIEAEYDQAWLAEVVHDLVSDLYGTIDGDLHTTS